jgi:hypothetical protein
VQLPSANVHAGAPIAHVVPSARTSDFGQIDAATPESESERAASTGVASTDAATDDASMTEMEESAAVTVTVAGGSGAGVADGLHAAQRRRKCRRMLDGRSSIAKVLRS